MLLKFHGDLWSLTLCELNCFEGTNMHLGFISLLHIEVAQVNKICPHERQFWIAWKSEILANFPNVKLGAAFPTTFSDRGFLGLHYCEPYLMLPVFDGVFAFVYLLHKKIARHTVHTILSWPNPKRCLMIHISALMRIHAITWSTNIPCQVSSQPRTRPACSTWEVATSCWMSASIWTTCDATCCATRTPLKARSTSCQPVWRRPSESGQGKLDDGFIPWWIILL